jgi:D-alanine-D-alanine ligase
MRVAVLSGGRSSERDVSMSTAAVVRDAVSAAGHDVVAISIDRSGTWRQNGERICLWPGEGLLDCDVVFPALHGPFGEDGTIQGLLELLDVPYVGAGVLASSLCMDKSAFKDVLAASGVPQVEYVAVREESWRADPGATEAELVRLGLPVFVKPARLGSSVGIVKATDWERLHAALETAFTHDGVAVVEQFTPGVEVECGVIGTTSPETSVPGQIELRGTEWYDYSAKYSRGGYVLQAPAQLSPSVCDEVTRLAHDTFLRVGCAGLARVDFFVDGDRVLVNEVNTLPGFTPTSDFPRLWEASGLALPQLCDRLVRFGVERFHTQRAGHTF